MKALLAAFTFFVSAAVSAASGSELMTSLYHNYSPESRTSSVSKNGETFPVNLEFFAELEPNYGVAVLSRDGDECHVCEAEAGVFVWSINSKGRYTGKLYPLKDTGGWGKVSAEFQAKSLGNRNFLFTQRSGSTYQGITKYNTYRYLGNASAFTLDTGRKK